MQNDTIYMMKKRDSALRAKKSLGNQELKTECNTEKLYIWHYKTL